MNPVALPPRRRGAAAQSAPSARGRAHGWLLGVLVVVGMALAWLVWPASPVAIAPAASPVPADADSVSRGRYLATLGNCQACHTPPGGEPFAGGRGLATPFGTVFSSNLTPSPTGLGDWQADDFWRALYHGQSRNGRWLYPAFPFNNTTHISRPDSDALFAFLRSLPPVDKAPPAHELVWPVSTQAALKVWRVLYFREGGSTPSPPMAEGDRSAQWQRGAYLVQGLGHCSACHAPRNALGANPNMLDLAGGLMPVQNWYAPSLTDPAEAGLQAWSEADIVALFQTGRARNAQVSGPMADVVRHSTQHWALADLKAMAHYLQQLPRTGSPPAHTGPTPPPQPRLAESGAKLYERHCAQCHGEAGEGVSIGDGRWAYLPLAGNRSVTLTSPANLVQTVLNGGFAPSTAGHPRPFGMPPFMFTLSDEEVAAVLTHLRTQWGHQAAPVSALDVQALRGAGH